MTLRPQPAAVVATAPAGFPDFVVARKLGAVRRPRRKVRQGRNHFPDHQKLSVFLYGQHEPDVVFHNVGTNNVGEERIFYWYRLDIGRERFDYALTHRGLPGLGLPPKIAPVFRQRKASIYRKPSHASHEAGA
jgi:hypothetical protein